MSTETKETLLYSQLQEGLKYELMESPAVSGAQGYKALCLAVRNEEKRLADLRKRRQLLKPWPNESSENLKPRYTLYTENPDAKNMTSYDSARRCYNCSKVGHLAKDCRAPRTESRGQETGRRWSNGAGYKKSTSGGAKRVSTSDQTRSGDEVVEPQASQEEANVNSCLYSSDSEETGGVRQVRVIDKGSHPQRAEVLLEGVPALGVIDSGADITIMGKDLLKRVAAVAKLKKSKLKKVDKVPKTYDGKRFSLDGRMDLDITFSGITMQTPVYIKLDASEQLLLSEGVCRQLEILTYHPDVVRNGERRSKNDHKTQESSTPEQEIGDGLVTHDNSHSKHRDTTLEPKMRTPTENAGSDPETRPLIEENMSGAVTGGRNDRSGDSLPGDTNKPGLESETHGGDQQRDQLTSQVTGSLRDEKPKEEEATKSEVEVTQATECRAGSVAAVETTSGVKREVRDGHRTRLKREDNKENGCEDSSRNRSVGVGCGWGGRKRINEDGDALVPISKVAATADHLQTEADDNSSDDAVVPSVRVYLLQSVRLPPRQSAFVPIKMEGNPPCSDTFLLEYDVEIEQSLGLRISDALVRVSDDGTARVVVTNPSGFTRNAEEGARLGSAIPVTVEMPEELVEDSRAHMVSCKTGSRGDNRSRMRCLRLEEILEGPDLPNPEKKTLLKFLADHHHAFCLEEGERGETDLIQMQRHR